MSELVQRPANGTAHPVNGASGNGNGATGPLDLPVVVLIASSPKTRGRVSASLEAHGLQGSIQIDTPDQAVGLDLDETTIIVFVCDIDVPKELASLRRLRREVREPALVAISPPATGTGVRRALDAGADALVFESDLEQTLGTTIRAVATGQSVVPRKLRASVERPVLSHREQQVLELVRKGMTNGEIAENLFLAESTIKSHLSSIFTKFGVRSRKEAVAVSFDLEPAVEPITAVAEPPERAPA